jgi:hypothetical protein
VGGLRCPPVEGSTLSAAQVIVVPDAALPARGAVAVYRPGAAADEVLDEAARLGFDAAEPGQLEVAVPGPGGLEIAPVRAALVPVPLALPALLSGAAAGIPAWRRPADSFLAWALAARLGVQLVSTHHMAPTLVGDEDALHGVWRVLLDEHPPSRAIADRIAASLPAAGHALHRGGGLVWGAEPLLRAFLDGVADALARDVQVPDRSAGRPRARLLPWTARWAEAVVDPEDPTVPLRDDPREVLAGIQTWQGLDAGGDEHTEVRLLAPAEQDGTWRLEFGVRSADGAFRAAEELWAQADDPQVLAAQDALLRGLGRCARVFPPLDVALRGAAPTRLDLDLEGAWGFIREAAPLLEGTGIIVALPEDLAEEPPRIRLRLDGDVLRDDDDIALADALGVEGAAAGDVAYSWEVALGDEPLDDDALEALLRDDLPLVRWRDRWVKVDPEVRARLGALGSGSLPLAEAMLLGLAGSAPVAALLPPSDALAETVGDGAVPDLALGSVDVVADGRVGVLLERLRAASEAPPAAVSPAGFHGTLRPYQARGVAWLGGMADLGLGAVLADSMGLGKTIQLIAHLLRRGSAGPHLVVCPTSVVGNWEREIERFAPGVAVTRFHGPDRPDTLEGVTGVVVTSYGVVRRDTDPLAAVRWDVVTLDEAQHVKNPTTAGARAVRRLEAEQVVVLTGTPLENRLAELWSVLDVTNRGLLGSRARFTRRYVTPIERRRDPAAAARLRRVVAPFILRREKTDPAVVSDLPPKIERTVVCPLTPEQAQLYQAAVDRVLGGDGLSGASAMERRGRVLALITELKQICNHPAQALRGRDPARARADELAGRSGKLAAAREIVREATEAGDQLLVFTQFVEMGRLLVAQLEADLGVSVPFLHGGVSATGRDVMVRAFQGASSDPVPPVLVVSLRAGGTGLNLTAATHVVHYDRWWNPAVEDQATDRAHRIGQHRTVEVHKLVTAGTVEERVADLLEHKRALADSVVGAGEQWITELGEAELRELVALSATAEEVEDDPDEDLDAWDEREAG